MIEKNNWDRAQSLYGGVSVTYWRRSNFFFWLVRCVRISTHTKTNTSKQKPTEIRFIQNNIAQYAVVSKWRRHTTVTVVGLLCGVLPFFIHAVYIVLILYFSRTRFSAQSHNERVEHTHTHTIDKSAPLPCVYYIHRLQKYIPRCDFKSTTVHFLCSALQLVCVLCTDRQSCYV